MWRIICNSNGIEQCHALLVSVALSFHGMKTRFMIDRRFDRGAYRWMVTSDKQIIYSIPFPSLLQPS